MRECDKLPRTCLDVMPFSVIVSLNDTTDAGTMKACCSMVGNGGASNDVQAVLFACVVPSYNSTEAVKQIKLRHLLLFEGTLSN